VDLAFQDIVFTVAVKAELLRFRDEQVFIGRAVGLMADPASTRSEGTMDHPFVELEDMAVRAELFDGDDKAVAASLVAGLACFGCKGSMFADPHFWGCFSSSPVCQAPGKIILFIFRVGDAVKEKTENLIFMLGCPEDIALLVFHYVMLRAAVEQAD
jgi:hypothetical protein